jgi:hypothetical protein
MKLNEEENNPLPKNILFDDDEILVVRLLTYKDACYYGSETRWCRDSEYSFISYVENGAIYLFINKEYGTKINLYVYDNYGSLTYWMSDSRNKPMKMDEFKRAFSGQKDLIDELVGKQDLIQTLKQFVKGKAEATDIKLSDDSITNVSKKTPLAQTELIIEFESRDELFESLDINEHDQAMFAFVKEGQWDFIDEYSLIDDFKEGYGSLYDFLNEENLQKMKEIAAIIVDGPVNLERQDYREKLAQSLFAVFPGYIEDILSEYRYYRDRDMNEVADFEISTEMNQFMEKIGFDMYSDNEVSTTVANLLMWVARFGFDKIDAKSLFNRIADSQGSSNLGGWSEDYWQYDKRDSFPENSMFHDLVGRALDNMIEILDEKGNLGEFNNFRNKIMAKFELNMWYDTPKEPSQKFRVTGFDYKDEPMVIITLFKDKNGNTYVKKLMNEEQFNLFLYQTELF